MGRAQELLFLRGETPGTDDRRYTEQSRKTISWTHRCCSARTFRLVLEVSTIIHGHCERHLKH